MNILNKISMKNLKLNKKRTISTIIGIILSVALICAACTLATSFQATLVQNAINESGYFHLRIDDVDENSINNLKNNRDIKNIYKLQSLGYAYLENCKNEDKPYLKLYSMEEEIFKSLKFKLVEGRFPKSSNEVIISKHIETNGEIKIELGQKLNLSVGQRKSIDEIELTPKNYYNKEDEKLINEKQYEFTVVGIIERPDTSFELYSDPGYTIITTGLEEGKTSVYISLKKPSEYKTSIAEILEVNDINDIPEKPKYKDYYINRELLRWEAFAFSDKNVQMLYSVIAVVVFIILFTSIFCIRNSFAISILEKTRMYGMLASIGATKKQIKKNVIFEARFLWSSWNSNRHIMSVYLQYLFYYNL